MADSKEKKMFYEENYQGQRVISQRIMDQQYEPSKNNVGETLSVLLYFVSRMTSSFFLSGRFLNCKM